MLISFGLLTFDNLDSCCIVAEIETPMYFKSEIPNLELKNVTRYRLFAILLFFDSNKFADIPRAMTNIYLLTHVKSGIYERLVFSH